MPAIRKEVTVTPADRDAGPYRYVRLDVPAGTTRIDVAMAYPKAEDCIVDLGVFDPRAAGFPSRDGFRGWSGGARDRFFVAADDATPGYVPGPIPAGPWHVALGLYRIPERGARVELTVSFDDGERAPYAAPPRNEPVRPGAGWYRGDLHCHTFHSDAAGSPERLHESARRAGLDFLAVTDHNTITQRRYFDRHSTPELVFLRGMEATTAEGHANVYGLDEWVDFRMSAPADSHILADQVHSRGGLLSINHDKPPIPWDYELPAADCMEVWQSHWFAWNWVSLERYDTRLKAGRRLSLIGGSDFHQPDREPRPGSYELGWPTTVLWLEELSEKAVLEAMRRGAGYVTESPDGPHLSFTANGRPMGSQVAGDAPVAVEAELRGGAGDRLVFVDATGTVREETIPDDEWRCVFALDGFDTFLRAEIVAAASRERLMAGLGRELSRSRPFGAPPADLSGQPLRRALANPVFARTG